MKSCTNAHEAVGIGIVVRAAKEKRSGFKFRAHGTMKNDLLRMRTGTLPCGSSTVVIYNVALTDVFGENLMTPGNIMNKSQSAYFPS